MKESRSYDPIIGTRTKQLLLEFFSKHPGKDFGVQELHEKLGIPESTTSISLNGLRTIGVLDAKKDGKYKLYKLNPHYAEAFKSVFSNLEQVFYWTVSARGGKYGKKK